MYMTFKIKYHIFRYTRRIFPLRISPQIALQIWSTLSSVRIYPQSSGSVSFIHLGSRRWWVILWNAVEREIPSYTPADAIQFLHAEAQKICRHWYTYVNNVQFHSEIYIYIYVRCLVLHWSQTLFIYNVLGVNLKKIYSSCVMDKKSQVIQSNKIIASFRVSSTCFGLVGHQQVDRE